MPKSRTGFSPRRGRWDAAEARRVLAALEASGLGLLQFAEREGLQPVRLQRWRRRLAREEGRVAFVEVGRPTSALGLIEVVLVTGRVVRVAESVDVAALGRIVEMLEQVPAC
jgi:hypothetical protein